MSVAEARVTSTYLRVAGWSDIGRKRPRNEDAFVIVDLSTGQGVGGGAPRFEVRQRGVLLAVSDGMGGAYAGDVASALVLDTLAREMARARSSGPARDAIVGAVHTAHERVRSQGERVGKAMGATLTAVWVREHTAYVAEIGDSRAYLIRSGRITRLTHDQSLAQQLLDVGAVTADQAEKSMFRNVILQAMGHQRDINVVLGRLQLRARDCFVLCSDGLTRHVNDEEIRSIVLASRDLGLACSRLVDAANARGGEDNITVLLGGVGGDLPAPSAATGDVERTYEVLMDWVGR
jgi:serine/threonine protein phosphatase PrpC